MFKFFRLSLLLRTDTDCMWALISFSKANANYGNNDSSIKRCVMWQKKQFSFFFLLFRKHFYTRYAKKVVYVIDNIEYAYE